MKCAVFSTKSYDRKYLQAAADATEHELVFFEPRLSEQTVRLAENYTAICTFVNDPLTSPILEKLDKGGTRFIALRCAGFNQVDLHAAKKLNIQLARVPAYSPYAVAEHAVGMTLTLCRHLHRAYNRVRDNNFSLEGLLGFDLHGRTVGIVGTGAIGAVAAKIFHGFGCNVLMHDPCQQESCRSLGQYVELPELFQKSDIVSLHCPLTTGTYHMINDQTIEQMKKGVMLVNTSRGALVDTSAVIRGLKTTKIGAVALDVYEEEADLFFQDLSGHVIQDDQFSRLLTFPNVLVTAHQAFFTEDALQEIARVTMMNLTQFERGEKLTNAVHLPT